MQDVWIDEKEKDIYSLVLELEEMMEDYTPGEDDPNVRVEIQRMYYNLSKALENVRKIQQIVS